MRSNRIALAKKAIEHLTTYGWVSLRQFSHLIDVAYPTVRAMADRKQVLTLPVGGVRRVYREEVERYRREGNRIVESTGSSQPRAPYRLRRHRKPNFLKHIPQTTSTTSE